MILQAEAAVGARSGLPVTKVIHKLCLDGRLVDEVDVTVTDVIEDGSTLVDIIAVVEHSYDIPITRAVIRSRLANLLLNRSVQFDLLVREPGIAGDAAETIWRLGKNVVTEGAVMKPKAAGRGQLEV